MSSDPTAENAVQQIQSVRPTFADEVIIRARQFGEDLLRLIPELEGVAIVPSYTIPQDRLPYGLIMGRDGALRTPQEIMHMSVQLHGCLNVQLNNAFQAIREIDGFMGTMRDELLTLQEQVNEKRRELANLSGSEEPQVADPADRTPPGDS